MTFDEYITARQKLQAIDARLADTSVKFGLTPTQAMFLYEIHCCQDKQVAIGRLRFAGSNRSYTVKKLISLGFIQRVPFLDRDSRAAHLVVTGGAKACAAIGAVFEEAHDG